MAAEGYIKEGSGGGAGLAGAVGPAGPAGADGDDGAAGDAGAAGPAGAAGATGAAGPDLSAVTEGALVKRLAGVPAAASPALDYYSPLITAPVASATTITLPETGGIVPITGNVPIDFITKPTGNVPRMVILWLQSTSAIRNEVAGAGAGTANISMFVYTVASNVSVVPQTTNTFVQLVFDGSNWRRVDRLTSHYDGFTLIGPGAALLSLATSGPVLQFSSTQKLTIANASATLKHSDHIDVDGRTGFAQATVASASNMVFTKSSMLVTGTADMNTFTPTSWATGGMLWLTFDSVLNINSNSGGANDYVSKDGTAIITTTPGMVLGFRFNGTDFVEVGR